MHNVEQLKLFDLPVLDGIDDLSNLTHLSKGHLSHIIRRADRFYRRVQVPKPHGGYRIIHQPSKSIKAVQYWILRHILDKINPSFHATAFRRGYSILDNVAPHARNRYFLVIDIKDFFPSITPFRVRGLFFNLGYSKYAASLLARMTTCRGALPQGGVTSPAIANLVTHRLDRRVSGLCSHRNIAYTRYADDMTFSSNNRRSLASIESTLYRIIQSEGFLVNLAKVRFTGPGIHSRVTGLVRNSSKPGFGVGRKKAKKMRSVFFNLIVNNRIIDEKYPSLVSANGWLSHAKSVDQSNYDYVKNYRDRLLNNS